MEVSILLMQQIAQLFIVLLMGYVVVKAGLLKASDSKVLSVVFVYLVMPCVVLNAFQIDDTPQIRTGLLYSMGIAVGMHIVFLVLNAIFKKPLRLDVVEQVNIIYSNAAALVIPLVQAMPETHQKYLTYNEDDFKVWAMSVGPMTEHVVDFFLESGKAPEQGYKACASLTKLGERYGKERLESACARVHAYGTTPSIRNISSILKSKQDVKAKTSTAQEQSSNTARYGLTRGASYFANGGEHK